jgi:predicted aspartyl protease
VAIRYNEVIESIQKGPLITVSVGLSTRQASVHKNAGRPVPVAMEMVAIIDTGASGTSISDSLARAMGMWPIGETEIFTAGSAQTTRHPIYEVLIGLPIGPDIDKHRVVGAPLEGHVQCLIGRDILQHAVLRYNGLKNQYQLEFPHHG